MKKGVIVYQGAASKAGAFLDQLGFPCPSDMSIADYLLEVISPANEKSEEVDEATKKHVPVDLSLG